MTRRTLFRVAGAAAMAAVLPKALPAVARDVVLILPTKRFADAARGGRWGRGMWRTFEALTAPGLSVVADKYMPEDMWVAAEAGGDGVITVGKWSSPETATVRLSVAWPS